MTTISDDDILPILDLPDGCLQYILLIATDIPHDYLKYSRVCRKFHRTNKKNKYALALKYSNIEKTVEDYFCGSEMRYHYITSKYYCLLSRIHGECYTVKRFRKRYKDFNINDVTKEYKYFEFGRMIDKKRWEEIGCPNKIPKHMIC